MLAVAALLCCVLIFLGGASFRAGVASYDCDNYGKSRIDGTWYECRETKGGDL